MIAKALPGAAFLMCSRYSLTSPPEAVRAYFGYGDTPNFPARYNVAQTQPVAVVALDREGEASVQTHALGPAAGLRQGPEAIPDASSTPARRRCWRSPRSAMPCASGAVLSRPTGFMNGPGPRASAAPFSFAREKLS